MVDLFSMCTFVLCMHLQNQRHNLAVVEAAAFTLSQLLQAEDAAEKIIPFVPAFFFFSL